MCVVWCHCDRGWCLLFFLKFQNTDCFSAIRARFHHYPSVWMPKWKLCHTNVIMCMWMGLWCAMVLWLRYIMLVWMWKLWTTLACRAMAITWLLLWFFVIVLVWTVPYVYKQFMKPILQLYYSHGPPECSAQTYNQGKKFKHNLQYILLLWTHILEGIIHISGSLQDILL